MLGRQNYGETDFVTGMRAWAAMGVLFIHSGGGGLRTLGDIGNTIVDFGSSGGYAFFVISGFSGCHSIKNSANYSDYIRKRLFRLLPAYYFIILFSAITKGKWSIENILMHLFMVSWVDEKVANSILSVEWTIPIEIFWY